MKIAFHCAALNRCIRQCFSLCNACHFQYISTSPILWNVSKQLRLSGLHCHFSSYSSVETEKLLARPEVRDFLQLLISEYGRDENLFDKGSPISDLLQQIKKYESEIRNLQTLSPDGDKDMEKLILAEEEQYRNQIKQINSELLLCALEEESDSEKSVTLEVSSGVGGQEAKLFSHELFNMYLKYAAFRNWNVSLIGRSLSDEGGINRAEACISGQHAFKLLKHEAGIHRVQRVPVTEKSGRVQTSTCKINVIPDIEDVEIQLNRKDLKIEAKTSSGPGGQNVNKCETCVRITHIPTGIVVECQSQRLQSDNQVIALKKLRHILYTNEQNRKFSKINELRKEQALTVARSDKIRTYNYLQNRVTDHRINHTVYNLDRYMEGDKLLDEMVLLVEKKYEEEKLLNNINKILKDRNFQELFKKSSKIG